jgi:DNA-binding HxlR family transcriptional regulator
MATIGWPLTEKASPMDEPMDGATGYGQYCPITRAVEVLGERWSMLILRDMLCGATRFNDIARGNPRLSRTLLSKRLRQLEHAGIVDHIGDEYLLTPAGDDLRSIVFGLGEWGAKWQFGDPRDHELDPELLMWWVHRRLDFAQLPDRRLVLEFGFRDQPQRYWIIKDAQGPSVCKHDPGFGIDATIESDLSTMYQVWLGKLPLRTAIAAGTVDLLGAPAIVRRLPATLQLSQIAPAVAGIAP